MIYGILILIVIIIPIGVAYYYDYKKDQKEFTFSVKSIGKGILKVLIYLVIIAGLNKVYKLIIPFNKDHGIEFNSERKNLGLPEIGNQWEQRNYSSDQFTVQWWNTRDKDKHFKKVIEYGIFSVRFETDYYENQEREEKFAWSKFDFSNGTFEYFVEKPNDDVFSISETGRMIIEKPTVIEKISQSEFEEYISK